MQIRKWNLQVTSSKRDSVPLKTKCRIKKRVFAQQKKFYRITNPAPSLSLNVYSPIIIYFSIKVKFFFSFLFDDPIGGLENWKSIQRASNIFFFLQIYEVCVCICEECRLCGRLDNVSTENHPKILLGCSGIICSKKKTNTLCCHSSMKASYSKHLEQKSRYGVQFVEFS